MRLSNIALAISAQYGGLFNPSSLFTPGQLFTTGVNGAWYDPSDMTTLFLDAAGTTPVTAVDQPVGLMLDKSKGLVLGSELASNLSGFSASNNFTASVTSTSITTTDGAVGAAQAILTVGRWYTIDVRGSTSTAEFSVNTADAISPTVRTAIRTGFGSCVFLADRPVLYFRHSTAGVTNITTLSVRELPGNHAFNSSGNSANFPVLSARYNLLTKTEDFSDAVWLKAFGGSGVLPTVSADVGLSPVGTQTADLITINRSTTTGLSFLTQRLTDDGVQKSRILYVKAFSALDVGKVLDTWTFDTAVANRFAITLTADWQKVTLPNATLSAGASRESIAFGYLDNGSLSPNTGEIKFYIWGADLRVANDALNQPAYQRVNTSTDYDTVGFKPYLRFNGTNQWLQTNSIDFTYGDKMFVSAGVRKLSDGATYIVLESSQQFNANSGAFAVAYPVGSSLSQPAFGSNGTTSQLTYPASGYAAPITNVLSGVGNISGDQTILRVNGTQVAINTGDQGTGNYGNYPLYIGARAGIGSWFNGRLYQMVVAGKQASAAEITSTETYINQRTNAF